MMKDAELREKIKERLLEILSEEYAELYTKEILSIIKPNVLSEECICNDDCPIHDKPLPVSRTEVPSELVNTHILGEPVEDINNVINKINEIIRWEKDTEEELKRVNSLFQSIAIKLGKLEEDARKR